MYFKLKKEVLITTFFLFLNVILTSPTSSSQNLNMAINAINEISIIGGNITLTINSAPPGEEPDSAIDNTSCNLIWRVNKDNKKITVKADISSTYTLKVEAQDLNYGGTSEGIITLTTQEQDFITSISKTTGTFHPGHPQEQDFRTSKTTGTCQLEYTLEILTSDEVGLDSHVITYTITS